ncbi:MAG: hypothetical protein V1695_04040, partial [Candidatus Uhrbacteria bacterium]
NSLGGDIDCGKQAEVSLDPGGDESDIENCFWSYCENGKSCLMPQSTDPNDDGTPDCKACADVYIGNPDGLPASDSICDGMTPERVNNTHYNCFFTGDESIVGLAEAFQNKFSFDMVGSCVMSTIDCDRVNDCSDYSYSPVTYGIEKNTTLHELPYPYGNYSLYNARNDNPCKYNGEEELQGGCALVSDEDFRFWMLGNPGAMLVPELLWSHDWECEADVGQNTKVTGW